LPTVFSTEATHICTYISGFSSFPYCALIFFLFSVLLHTSQR